MGLNSVRTLHTTKRMTAAMRKPVYIRRISSAVKGIFLVMALSSQHEIFLRGSVNPFNICIGQILRGAVKYNLAFAQADYPGGVGQGHIQLAHRRSFGFCMMALAIPTRCF